jgi:tetrahydromethanopterin S-methyltransferase subunit E
MRKTGNEEDAGNNEEPKSPAALAPKARCCNRYQNKAKENEIL